MITKRFNPYLMNVLAFFIPVTMICLLMIHRDILPFGDKTFLSADLDIQYVDFSVIFRMY